MKKAVLKTLCLLIIPAMISAEARAESTSANRPPEITAEAAIVMDADTCQIYYEKNMHERLYPASITKILTGLVVVEHSNPGDEVVVPDDVVQCQRPDYSHIALRPGEKLTVDALLSTMFLASANDSAYVLAKYVGKTVENFVQMMNERAIQAGCVDSSFSNPHGLPDTNNITSAYDMALIADKAVQNPTLMKYFSMRSYTLPATNKRSETLSFSTIHKMMKQTAYFDPDVIAGKTGWETMSKNTMVTVAKKDGRTLICVQMKVDTSGLMYTEARALLDYGFAQPAKTGGAASSSINALVVQAKAPVVFKPSPEQGGRTSNKGFPVMVAALMIVLTLFLAGAAALLIKRERYIRRRRRASRRYQRAVRLKDATDFYDT